MAMQYLTWVQLGRSDFSMYDLSQTVMSMLMTCTRVSSLMASIVYPPSLPPSLR